MRIAIVGNCQARPAGDLLSIMSDAVTVDEPIVVHLSGPSTQRKETKTLRQADIILTQPIADGYPAEHLWTSKLTEAHGDRVRTWPNLYFTGYNPELRYLRRPGKGTLQGPLGDYHVGEILGGFRAGSTAQETLRRWIESPSDRGEAAAVIEGSLANLRAREASLDVQMCDMIEHHIDGAKLFHTFNHPSLSLLSALAMRIIGALSLNLDRRVSSGMLSEPLGQYMLPTHRTTRPVLSIGSPDSIRTPKFTLGGPTGIRFMAGHQIMSTLEVVEAFFQFYSTVDPADLTEH